MKDRLDYSDYSHLQTNQELQWSVGHNEYEIAPAPRKEVTLVKEGQQELLSLDTSYDILAEKEFIEQSLIDLPADQKEFYVSSSMSRFLSEFALKQPVSSPLAGHITSDTMKIQNADMLYSMRIAANHPECPLREKSALVAWEKVLKMLQNPDCDSALIISPALIADYLLMFYVTRDENNNINMYVFRAEEPLGQIDKSQELYRRFSHITHFIDVDPSLSVSATTEPPNVAEAIIESPFGFHSSTLPPKEVLATIGFTQEEVDYSANSWEAMEKLLGRQIDKFAKKLVEMSKAQVRKNLQELKDYRDMIFWCAESIGKLVKGELSRSDQRILFGILEKMHHGDEKELTSLSAQLQGTVGPIGISGGSQCPSLGGLGFVGSAGVNGMVGDMGMFGIEAMTMGTETLYGAFKCPCCGRPVYHNSQNGGAGGYKDNPLTWAKFHVSYDHNGQPKPCRDASGNVQVYDCWWMALGWTHKQAMKYLNEQYPHYFKLEKEKLPATEKSTPTREDKPTGGRSFLSIIFSSSEAP